MMATRNLIAIQFITETYGVGLFAFVFGGSVVANWSAREITVEGRGLDSMAPEQVIVVLVGLAFLFVVLGTSIFVHESQVE